jgi:hypothetical protein
MGGPLSNAPRDELEAIAQWGPQDHAEAARKELERRERRKRTIKHPLLRLLRKRGTK